MSTTSPNETDSAVDTDSASESAELGDQLDHLELDTTATQFLSQLIDDIEDARAEAEDAYTMALSTRKRLRQAEHRIEELEDENESLRRTVSEVDQSTSLLQAASADSTNVVETRAARLLQTLFNEAYDNKTKDNTKAKPTASMDWRGAKYALGGSLAREQLYAAMKRAVALVHPDVNEADDQELADPDNVVRFITEPRSSEKNTRVVIDLEDVDELETSTGQTITPPGGNAA